MEGVHKDRSLSEVYEKHEAQGYTQYCVKTPGLAHCYRLYAAYSMMSKITEGNIVVTGNLKQKVYGLKQSASRVKKELRESLTSTNSSSIQRETARYIWNRIKP